MRKTLPSLTLLLLSTLSSCYCFTKRYTPPSIKTLDSPRSYTLCDTYPGKGIATRASLYYGAPSTDYFTLAKEYNTEATQFFNFSSRGEFGGRLERYIHVGMPIPLLGLGVDYSYTELGLDLKHINNGTSYTTELSSFHHRINFSMSYITLVKKRSMGYFIGQIGLEFTNTFESSNIPNFTSAKLFPKNALNYRMGYGYEHYFNRITYIAIEGGYGGGGYIRIGIGAWLF